MLKRLPKARKDFKLDGILYKKGDSVDYLKWPRHTQYQLINFLDFEKGVPAKLELVQPIESPNTSNELKEVEAQKGE